MDLPMPLLAEIAAECRLRHPAEACGLLFADAAGGLSFVAIPNIAGTQAAAGTSARTGRDGYVMDPKRMMQAMDAAESKGATLAAIVHSHPEVGAYFSKEDSDMALGGGDEPLWPGVDYLVVSVRAGAAGPVADEARIYRWNPVGRIFDETKIPGIAEVS